MLVRSGRKAPSKGRVAYEKGREADRHRAEGHGQGLLRSLREGQLVQKDNHVREDQENVDDGKAATRVEVLERNEHWEASSAE